MALSDQMRKVLTKLGEPVTFTYETGEVRDPATGEIITPATTLTLEGFGAPENYTSSEIDGTVVQQGDIRLTVDRVGQLPQPGWSCDVTGRTYRVMDATRIRFKAADVVYQVQLRV